MRSDVLSINMSGIWHFILGKVSSQGLSQLTNTTAVIKVLIAVYCLFAKELSGLREPGATNEGSVCEVYNKS